MALHQPTYRPHHNYHPSRRPATPPPSTVYRQLSEPNPFLHLQPHPTPELTPPKMELAVNKVGGPMGGPMAAPSSGLAGYAAQMVVWLWFGTHLPTPSQSMSPTSTLPPASSPPIYPLNPLQIHPTQAFARFVAVILQTTLVSHSVTIVALLYIYRLKLKHRNILGQPGSEFRLFVSSLVLSNKFLDDNTYTNRTWAEIAGIDLKEVNGMETEFLEGLNYDLGVEPTEYRHWLSLLDGFVAAREREAAAVAHRERVAHQGGPYHSPVSPYQEVRARSASPLPPNNIEGGQRSSPIPARKRSAVDAFALDLPQPYEVLDHLRYPAKQANGTEWGVPAATTVPPPTSATRTIARMPSNGNGLSRRGSLQGDVTMSTESRPQTAMHPVDGRGYRVLVAPYERPPQHSVVPPEQMLFYTLSARSHPGQDGAPRKAVLHYLDPSHPPQAQAQHSGRQQLWVKSHRPSLSAEHRNTLASQPYRGSTLSTSTSPTEMMYSANSVSPMDFSYAPPPGRPLPPLDTQSRYPPGSAYASQVHTPIPMPPSAFPPAQYMFDSPTAPGLPNPFDNSYLPQSGTVPAFYPYAPVQPAQPRPASFANAGAPGYIYGQPMHPQQPRHPHQATAYSAHPPGRPIGLGLQQNGSRSEWSSPARERSGWY